MNPSAPVTNAVLFIHILTTGINNLLIDV
jgi:hypothetical protein